MSAVVVGSYILEGKGVPVGVAAVVVICAFGRAMTLDLIQSKLVDISSTATEAATSVATSVLDRIWHRNKTAPAPAPVTQPPADTPSGE